MHIPVLLNETLQYLDPKPGDNFIDCTVGEGGHALAILKMIAPNGKVLGIDRDADMVGILKNKAKELGVDERLIIHHGNFSQVAEIAQRHGFFSVNGILFDFGMSSWQLEESGAGFSFQNIEPLDMRFDRTKISPTAATIVNVWPEESIRRVIEELGEERYARRIAREIARSRLKEKIRTTDQLVRVISRAVPRHGQRQKIHVATRTFQALRIAVNSELEHGEKGLREAITLLSSGGRIAAISFHSLEDRRVKHMFREYSQVEGGPPPPKATEGKRLSSGLLKILTKKPVRPTPEEVMQNPRARSAKLRAAERI